MDEKGELTNVPDYQKIRQTSHSTVTGQGWSEDVEVLVPSPVVRPPGGQASTTSPRPRSLMQVGGGHPSLSLSQQSQLHHHEGKGSFSLDSRDDSPSPYIPQGYARQVTKYIDANGVERRFIRSAVAPNRRSFTEDLLMKADGSSSHALPGSGAALIRHATSHKNLYQDFSSHSAGNVSDSGSRGEFGNFGEGRLVGANRHSFSNVRQQQKGPVGSSSYSGFFQSSPGGGGGGGGDDEWKKIGGSHMVLKNHQEGLRHWQQQHQEELLHQHLETQALYESPSNQSLLLNGPDQNFSKRSIQDEPPARWEPVRRAADTIIREKNMIIDKLKNRILELEEDFKESESKLRQALLSRDDDADIAKDKLQGLQHSNATLKERLNEERAKKNSEIDDLELKLGSAEHEIQKLKEVLRNKASDVSDIQTQLMEKTREAEAWHEKFKESCEGHQDMKKKLDGLQRYLDELPTVEESQMQAQQDNVALKTRNEGLDKKLSQVRKIITARDFRIRDLEQSEQSLKHKVEEITEELDRLRDTDGSEFFNVQRELEHVKSEKERYAIDLEKAKKLLETTHQKLRHVEVKYQAELKTAQERLTQEEETVVSLKNEVIEREMQIAKMKKSMKEVNDASSTGSSGYSSCSIKGRSRSGSAETSSVPALQRQFMQQLGLCFSELQAVVNVCFQRARGEDPDISLLLGVKNGAVGGESEQTDFGVDSAKAVSQWLTKLGELRREIDRLRAHICNKYAEDMGDNMTCATQ
ncbi:hypothetical protein EGW08_018679 [Elysia chlorotica]|uniref:Centrosomal protein of 85 kDa-like CC4 coiled-coil domain-containing protein n=1 Tax=Elysia chlorotica TaxID=188477 RepID=A0A433SW82_ELYCH|nr:hypothetical protein EGW08_018679 [Elysia chlorotica]